MLVALWYEKFSIFFAFGTCSHYIYCLNSHVFFNLFLIVRIALYCNCCLMMFRRYSFEFDVLRALISLGPILSNSLLESINIRWGLSWLVSKIFFNKFRLLPSVFLLIACFSNAQPLAQAWDSSFWTINEILEGKQKHPQLNFF